MDTNLNYKIYYINLDRSKTRNDSIKEQLNNLKQTYTRISAVNGSDLDDEIVQEASNTQSLIMSLVHPSTGAISA